MILFSKEEKPQVRSNVDMDSTHFHAKSDSFGKCFLSFALILKEEDPEEMGAKAKEISEYIKERYPDVDLQFFNFKDGMYSFEYRSNAISYPFIDGTPIDKECIFESILELQKRKEYQDKKGNLARKYLVCVYALITNGWLGVDTEKMDHKTYIGWLKNKGIFTYEKSRLSEILSYLSKRYGFPNWKTDIAEAVKFTHFQIEFINIYWGIMLSKYGSFDEIKGLKTE